jgi:hypothetical protein
MAKAVTGLFVRGGAVRTGAAGIVIVWAHAELDMRQAEEEARTATVEQSERRPDMRGIFLSAKRTA